jgi:hypothetical protein
LSGPPSLPQVRASGRGGTHGGAVPARLCRRGNVRQCCKAQVGARTAARLDRKDKFGLSWQIIPKLLNELLRDQDKGRANRVMQAMLQMKKIECDALREAYEQPVNA